MRRLLVSIVLLATVLAPIALPAPAEAAANAWPHSIVSGFSTPTGQGFWLVYADGTVETHGDAGHFGDASGLALVGPLVGGAVTPSGSGYWLVAEDGGIFAYGDAAFLGSMGGQRLDEPVFSMTPTATGAGYWLVARDGGIFSFGDAQFYGSMGGQRLDQPITGITTSSTGRGYRMVARDGGIFSFGDVAFQGSLPGLGLSVADAVGMAPTPGNGGYWIARADGSVYSFGNAGALSDFDSLVCDPVAALFSNPNAVGYRLVLASGRSMAFGSAPGGLAPTGGAAGDCARSIDACRLTSPYNDEVKVGWPRSTRRLPSTGTARIAVLFVDFSDVVATTSTAQRYIDAGFPEAEAYLESQSFGRLDMQFVPIGNWLRMSQQSWQYRINRSEGLFFPLFGYMTEAIERADPQFDFSDIDGVVVVPPASALSMNVSPAFVPNHPVWGVEADGNTIMSGFARGTDWSQNGAEVIYHELGHTLGLVDAYAYESGFPDLHRFVGIFDPMGNLDPDSGGNEMLAWHRWQLDWIDDAQVYCVDELASPHLVSPVATQGGTDAVVVPVSDTRVVVIESRRRVGVDTPLGKTGALVYTVDSSVASGYGPIEVAGQHGPGGPEADVLLAVGESIEVNGVRVSVTAADATGDTVLVSRP